MASSLLTRLTRKLAGRRSELPRWLSATTEYALERPTSIVGRLAYRALGDDTAEATPNPKLLAPNRVYIGPLNYAGQAHLWATALREERADTDAVNAAVVVPRSSLNFAADIEVPLRVYRGSEAWRRSQETYLRGFTHVIAESGRSLFGERAGSNPFDELAALRSDGLVTAVMLHGSDARLPSRHSRGNAASPFHDDRRHVGAERRVQELLTRLEGFDGPVFVSTPDLLVDVPWARWCPVVVDARRWASEVPPLTRDVPVVVHVPSRASLKGTDLIEPAIKQLDAEGVVSYRRIENIAPSDLPEVMKSSDIVLDQFALGSYGVAACEGMAAGRVVVGHVTGEVRHAVQESSGDRLPIIQSEANDIGRVIRHIVSHREEAVENARQGVRFVSTVHSGRLSARIMADALRLSE
jgi:hypothetical protein